MSIEEFLTRLEGVQATGDGKWVACCPAHPDKNPSLGVSVGRDGRILVHCYAGCTAEAVVEALGLKMSDLMPPSADGAPKRKAARKKEPPKVKAEEIVRPLSEYKKAPRDYGKLVKAYDYQDENGAVIFRVERRVKKDGKKTFIQMHPDPESRYGWTWGVTKAGVQRVPFRLPRILKAAKDGKSVVVLEGEKDVLEFEKRIGGAATCNPGGAGKWEPGWGKYFEGVRSVLIVADKDPTEKKNKKTGEIETFAVGQRHACDVEAKLRADGYQGEIKKIVVRDVEGDFCKDFTDWAEARERHGLAADREAFFEEVRSFPGWPKAWEFADENAESITRADRTARNTASSEPPGDGGEVSVRDGREAFGDAGRFGRLCPRAPFKERKWYEVDFQMDAKRIARFAVGQDGIQFEGWQRQGGTAGDFILMQSFDEVKCPPSRMFGMAIGCLSAFADDFKIAPPQRTELACSLALAWLRSRGTFFADVDNPMYATSLYFDGVDGVLYSIQSDEFKSLLSTATFVSRENKVFKFMMALLEDLTMDRAETQRIRPSRQFDRKNGNIYLSCGDSLVYRISPGKIEQVANGTDGVVFVRGETLLPFKLLDGPGMNPFEESMLFRYASLGKKTDALNCLLWTFNCFFCDQNKPIILFNGQKGSGKTFLAQGILQFIGVRSRGVLDDNVEKIDKTDKSMETFWLLEDQKRVVCFDNFDYRIPWADNDMQLAATGGSHNARELYKTAVLVTMHARAYFMLTSNNAVFASEGGGLPDRIIKIDTVGRPKESKGPSVLRQETLDRRDEYMTFFMRTLAKALADTSEIDGGKINKRHPEFATNAIRIGRALGREEEAISALSIAETDKAVLPLVNDVVAKEIVAVLMRQESHGVMTFTAGDMSKSILEAVCGDICSEYEKTKYGPIRVAKSLNTKFRADFDELFEIKRDVCSHTKGVVWVFKGLTDKGKNVEMDLLKCCSADGAGVDDKNKETPILEGVANGVYKNNTTTPAPTATSADAPHARAPIDDVSFPREEENSKSTEFDDVDDDEPWFQL